MSVESELWNQIVSDHNHAIDNGLRICAVCLVGVQRDTYAEHMEQAHGYETLVIEAAQ